MFSFNLLDEPWISCVRADGSLSMLSLRGVLLNSTDIREILGDSPPVTIALHRFLLAILHRALNAPQDYEDWNSYWQSKTWNKEGKLDKYFANWEHRFDLFDEKRPFYQVSSIKESIQDGAIIQLYFQGKNNATLFEHSTTGEPKAVSPAEAARFLITFQGFDFGGIKADGSAQTAPLLNSAIGLVRGENLFETLMLNWHCYSENDDEPFPFSQENDLPPWERNSETEPTERKANGTVDLFAWQPRCILLQPEINADGEIVVKNTVIMRGFQFPKGYESYNKETMMAFRKSKTEGFYSVGFNENKALWRDSLSLFQTIEGEQYRPKMLDWLNELIGKGFLKRSFVFPIEFYGLSSDKAKLLFWQQEKFNLPLAYLSDNELLNKLKTAIGFSEEISYVLKGSLKNLAESLNTNAANFSAVSIYWASLENEFKKLMLDLPEKQDEAMGEWFRIVDKAARESFDQTTKTLSGSAAEIKAIVNARGVFNAFRGKLLKTNSIYQEYLPNYKTKGGS